MGIQTAIPHPERLAAFTEAARGLIASALPKARAFATMRAMQKAYAYDLSVTWQDARDWAGNHPFEVAAELFAGLAESPGNVVGEVVRRDSDG